MLKGIPVCLSPDLLKKLCEMGHGDTVVIGDAYFAAASLAKEGSLVRADGISATEMLDAVLSLMPLDHFVNNSVRIMANADSDGILQPVPMYDNFMNIIKKHDPDAYDTAQLIDRFDFYKETAEAYTVIACGEPENYGCIILQKGI